MAKKQRLLKRSSAEYKEISEKLALTNNLPTYDEWLHDMREQWKDGFTDQEKHGHKDMPGPIDFLQYMREAHATLRWRIEKDAPERFERGLLDKNDMVANTEFLEKLKEYSLIALAELEKESVNVN